MDDVIQLQTTTDRRESALALAQDLVAHGLAACVQISGPVTSVYRWQGKVEQAEEWVCVIKTVRRLYAQVEQRIREMHDYDEPEIIAVSIVAGSPSYLDWLRAQLMHPEASD